MGFLTITPIIIGVLCVKTVRGLVMGRFQPFHLGHVDLIEQAISECDDIIIAVTSTQFNYLEKDPFTAGERIEMIYNTLREYKINAEKYIVLGLENQHNVAIWPAYLRTALPSFQRAYSGNPYVSALLQDYGIEVVMPKMIKRDRFNATSIRRLMASGGDWRGAVPPAVARFLDSIGGEGRVRMIFDSDTDPTSH